MYTEIPRGWTRSKLFTEFTNNPEAFAQLAQEHGTTLKPLFNTISKSEKSSDEWADCAFEDMVARSGLITRDIDGLQTSVAGEVCKKAGGEQLLNEYIGNYYRNILSIPELETKSTVSAQPQESPQRMATDLEIIPRTRYQPRLRIADIGGAVDTIPTTDWRRPIFENIGRTERASTVRAEGSNFTRTRVKLEKRIQTMKQYGGAIEYSRNFVDDSVRVSALTMWAEEKAKHDEVMIVREGIRLAKANGGTASSVGANPDIDDILNWNMRGDTGHVFDTILCRASDARTLVKAWINAMGTNTNFSPDPRFFNEAFPSIGIINNISGPVRLGFIDDDATDLDDNAIFAAADVLFLDSTVLRFKRRSNGFLDEEEYTPSDQMFAQYISDWFDWEVTQAGGCDLVTMS